MNADMRNRGTEHSLSLFFFQGGGNVHSAPLWIRHCVQFEYCFSIIGLYIDIYGFSIVVQKKYYFNRLKELNQIEINFFQLSAHRQYTIQHDRADSIGRVLLRQLNFILISRKTFLLYSILTFHKFFFIFVCTTDN